MPASNHGRTPAPPTLRDLFERDSLPVAQVRVDAHEPIYATGDDDDAMYLVESGQVKIALSSAGGQDCLIAIYTAGDVFGESCFDGSGRRIETATAMLPTLVRRAARSDVVAEMQRADATETMLRHLAVRLGERQTAVFDLVTMHAERRLAKVLLQLADKLGETDGEHLTIEQRISHEELAEIVGTTRPRVTAFMQRFRQKGILVNKGTRSIRVHRQKMLEFLGLD
jgi:CRP/FNR family cyclic AMP-dependent transcriptional regulator